MNKVKINRSAAIGAAFILFLTFINVSAEKSNLKLIEKRNISVNQENVFILKSGGGDIKINTWERPEILIKIYGNSKARKSFKFHIIKDKNSIILEGKKHDSSIFNWFSNPRLMYEITLPTLFNSNLLTSGGDVRVSGISGESDISTSGGDIFVTDGKGNVNAKTSGGDIKISYFNGSADLATSGGDILCNRTSGDIDAKTSGGDIKIISSRGSISARTSGGDINVDYSGVNKGIELYSSGGDISVKIPLNFSALAELKTAGGEIFLNLQNTKTIKKSKYSLVAKINSGSEPLICKTIGGDITILEK